MTEGTGKGCVVEVADVDGRPQATLAGDADMRSSESIGAALARLHEKATAAHAAEVVIDVTRVGFMNAACLKTLVVWLSRLAEAASPPPYAVRIVSDERVAWQRRSLPRVAAVAAEVVSLEVIAR